MPESNKPIDIFLIEDKMSDIELVRESFEEAKISNTFHYVTDGEKALDYLYQRGDYQSAIRPSIVLLDINIPKINGLEVLKKIKTDDNLKTIPVVMLTTSGNEDDVNESYRNYANCYIKKPLAMEGLQKIVDTFEFFWFQIVELPSD